MLTGNGTGYIPGCGNIGPVKDGMPNGVVWIWIMFCCSGGEKIAGKERDAS